MLFKTGLLIVTNPRHIGKILCTISQHVNNILYIQLITSLSEPFGSYQGNVYNSYTIRGVYTQAAALCEDLDVRVLLSGLKYKNLKKIKTLNTVDVVIFDRSFTKSDIDSFIQGRIANVNKECGIVTMDMGKTEKLDVMERTVYNHTVLGGTFDRLHIAHKLLLTEAALRSKNKVTIGVTEENMLEGKTLWELIQPVEYRIKQVQYFLQDIHPELDINVVPIDNPFGPTRDDPTMDMLVVSEDTIRGGYKVNELRKEKGLSLLDIVLIELIDEPHHYPHEDIKISSSTARIRSLGTLLKPVQPNNQIPSKPYVIGFTGGIASGKSGVVKRLAEHGAHVFDCDKIAHELYEPGKPCYDLVVAAFGKSILTENGQIDRKILGGIVFKDPNELQKLNSLVWPRIAEEVKIRIRNSTAEVVVVEAAVLLSAHWEKFCHEVWVTIVPRAEAILRLQSRNSFTEEQAKTRLDSQPANKTYVDAANVVFCSVWPVESTRMQIAKAWYLLRTRIV